MSTRKDVELIVNKILGGFRVTYPEEIPKIDLYMDQVLTFMTERLKRTARKSDADKLLTKTMINNYVKNKVMIPPVKKKYGRDHILLLMVIYYMKSFLSIDDIRKIVGPVSDKYAQPTTKYVEDTRSSSSTWRKMWSAFPPRWAGSWTRRKTPLSRRPRRTERCCAGSM